jgi:hypothetical protein
MHEDIRNVLFQQRPACLASLPCTRCGGDPHMNHPPAAASPENTFIQPYSHHPR